MEREAAVQFFMRLMRNYQINAYRFYLPDFPQTDMGLRRTLGIGVHKNCFPGEEEIAPETIYISADPALSHVSSTIVMDIARHKGPLEGFVPPQIIDRVRNAF